MKQSLIQRSSFYPWASLGLLIGLAFFTGLRPAFAHQGGTDIHTFNGLWAGIRHPFMGLDHLLLVVAAGLLAARKHGSIVWTFTSASLAGIGLALIGMVVPSAVAVAIALVGVGILLIQSHTVATSLMFGGVAIAGFCHGYPHGALLATVSPSAQVTFLLSFILTQLTLGYVSCGVTRRLLNPQQSTPLMLPGLGICGVGVAYLSATFF